MSELKHKLMLNKERSWVPCYLKSEADKVIAELKAERRWRKCSEEMPEDGAEVLASDGDGIWLCYKTTMCDGSPWFQPDGLPHIEGVTHWMPLPEPPEVSCKKNKRTDMAIQKRG